MSFHFKASEAEFSENTREIHSIRLMRRELSHQIIYKRECLIALFPTANGERRSLLFFLRDRCIFLSLSSTNDLLTNACIKYTKKNNVSLTAKLLKSIISLITAASPTFPYKIYVAIKSLLTLLVTMRIKLGINNLDPLCAK